MQRPGFKSLRRFFMAARFSHILIPSFPVTHGVAVPQGIFYFFFQSESLNPMPTLSESLSKHLNTYILYTQAVYTCAHAFAAASCGTLVCSCAHNSSSERRSDDVIVRLGFGSLRPRAPECRTAYQRSKWREEFRLQRWSLQS